MSLTETAQDFFEACETGKGWTACAAHCHPDASFSCQAAALADITTVEAYTAWMAGLLGPIPDGHYELLSFSEDSSRSTVTAAAVFKGTQTGDGGPVPATGKAVASDYAYVMQFDGAKIRHVTKIWNDSVALQQLGWA